MRLSVFPEILNHGCQLLITAGRRAYKPSHNPLVKRVAPLLYFTTTMRFCLISLILSVLLLGCEQPNSEDNCSFKDSDYTLSDLFVGLVVDEADSWIYFNYLGNSTGTHPVGIYRYNIDNMFFDSVLTGVGAQFIVRDIQTYENYSYMLLALSGDIWRLEIKNMDLVRLTDKGTCFAPFYISGRNMVSYTKSTEPNSGIWTLDLNNARSSFVYPYSAYAVWNATGSMFFTEYTPNHSLHQVDSSGTLIDVLIETGQFRKIIPRGFSKDGSTIIFVGVPINSSPDNYYVYSFDMNESVYSKLALGTTPVLSTDETTIYYNGIHPDELGIWKMTEKGCDHEMIFSRESFENFLENTQGRLK